MGIGPFLFNRANAFRTCLNTCGLMDLDFSGPKFTWSIGPIMDKIGTSTVDW